MDPCEARAEEEGLDFLWLAKPIDGRWEFAAQIVRGWTEAEDESPAGGENFANVGEMFLGTGPEVDGVDRIRAVERCGWEGERGAAGEPQVQPALARGTVIP